MHVNVTIMCGHSYIGAVMHSLSWIFAGPCSSFYLTSPLSGVCAAKNHFTYFGWSVHIYINTLGLFVLFNCSPHCTLPTVFSERVPECLWGMAMPRQTPIRGKCRGRSDDLADVFWPCPLSRPNIHYSVPLYGGISSHTTGAIFKDLLCFFMTTHSAGRHFARRTDAVDSQ